MQDRIVEMLGNGIPPANVAIALGCSESLVSQVLSQDGVSEQVTALRAARFAEFAEHDTSIETAESKALKRLDSLIPFITKPAEAARVFGILNGAARKTGAAAGATASPSTVVQLNLPKAAQVSFTLTTDKQVIEVEGRSMVTMPAKSLAARLEQRNAARLLDLKVPQLLDVPATLVSAKL